MKLAASRLRALALIFPSLNRRRRIRRIRRRMNFRSNMSFPTRSLNCTSFRSRRRTSFR
jgi:hypothetical protein